MLTACVKNAIEASTPNEVVTFVIRLDVADQKDSLKRITDFAERRGAIQNLYHAAKRPMMAAVSRYEAEGLRVTNTLEGTSQMIVSGPARAWRHFFDSETEVLAKPYLTLTPNQPSWSALR